MRASDDAVINADWINAGTYEVNVGGQLYPVSVSLRPLYDPANEKVRDVARIMSRPSFTFNGGPTY